MSIDEASDLYHQFEERKMGKTVTVEVELPDGYELAEPKMRKVKPGDIILWDHGIPEEWKGPGPSCINYPILRPIPAEKTWERPEWLHNNVKYITHDSRHYWRAWEEKPEGYQHGYWQGSEHRSTAAINPLLFPRNDLPPAERIWRIVERGQG